MTHELQAQQRRPVVSKTATQLGTMAQAQQRRLMPNVIDSTASVARAMLARLKITVTVTTRDTTSAAHDQRVFSQSPPPGSPLPAASVTAELGVYRYVPVMRVSVPNVIGRPVALAVRLLQRATLTPSVPRAAGLLSQLAVVADQVPKGGTSATAGDTVTLIVDVSAQVPLVVGLDMATATRLLVSRGLDTAVAGTEYSDDVPAGRIVRQHPDSGTAVRPGDAVSVWTSLGAHPPEPAMTMPRLTGLSLAEATATLVPLQLQITHVDSIFDAQRAGRIVDQQPGAGVAVHARDPVSATVATAPIDRVIPWVVGEAWPDAASRLKDSSFVASLRFAPGDGIAPRIVMRQSVDSGQRRPPRTVIVVTVADTAGPPPPPSRVMTDVVGRTRAVAIDTLGFLSARITIVEQVVRALGSDGLVVSQEPPAGAIVFPPVDVVLQVGRYQQLPVPDTAARDSTARDATLPRDSTLVPSLIGLRLRRARALLLQARLALGEVRGADASPDSLVASQTPDAGLPVAVGVAVGVVLRAQREGADTSIVIPPPITEEINLAPFLIILGGGVVAGVLLARIRRKPRPSVVHVALRPSPAGPPAVELPLGESVVENAVALIDLAPEIEIDLPTTLIEREEEHDGQ
ncbi:MAG: PASTA domain-containing protein [Gemmatimonadota bacterium]